MTLISIETVESGDLLKLAALPQPTMILDVAPFTKAERQVALAVVAASVPRARRTSRRAAPIELPKPRPARSHITLALNPGGTS